MFDTITRVLWNLAKGIIYFSTLAYIIIEALNINNSIPPSIVNEIASLTIYNFALNNIINVLVSYHILTPTSGSTLAIVGTTVVAGVLSFFMSANSTIAQAVNEAILVAIYSTMFSNFIFFFRAIPTLIAQVPGLPGFAIIPASILPVVTDITTVLGAIIAIAEVIFVLESMGINTG